MTYADICWVKQGETLYVVVKQGETLCDRPLLCYLQLHITYWQKKKRTTSEFFQDHISVRRRWRNGTSGSNGPLFETCQLCYMCVSILLNRMLNVCPRTTMRCVLVLSVYRPRPVPNHRCVLVLDLFRRKNHELIEKLQEVVVQKVYQPKLYQVQIL